MKLALSLLVASVILTLAPAIVRAGDFPANHCEIFADQVEAWGGTYGYEGIAYQIKILPARLSGPAVRVGFYGRIVQTPEAVVFCRQHANEHPGEPDCASLGVFQDRPLSNFFGPDYFRFELVLKHDYTFNHVYEGAFYVQSANGNRYWLNAKGGGNFVFDYNQFRNLIDLGSGGYYHQARRLNAAQSFDYANPNHCN